MDKRLHLTVRDGNPDAVMSNLTWAFTMLSDIQHMGVSDAVNAKLNAVKRVLQGKYEELDGGFCIRVEEPRTGLDTSWMKMGKEVANG